MFEKMLMWAWGLVHHPPHLSRSPPLVPSLGCMPVSALGSVTHLAASLPAGTLCITRVLDALSSHRQLSLQPTLIEHLLCARHYFKLHP